MKSITIPNEILPEGIQKYIKWMSSQGGLIELEWEFIHKAYIKKGIINDCTYKNDGKDKLEWFTVKKILYIFVNDVQHYYYEDGKLHS